jgi:hypothetical protein
MINRAAPLEDQAVQRYDQAAQALAAAQRRLALVNREVRRDRVQFQAMRGRAYDQWAALPHVPMSAIQPGDLIFFDGLGHVALYVGSNVLLDAPQPGEYVGLISLSSSWYASTVVGAARQ